MIWDDFERIFVWPRRITRYVYVVRPKKGTAYIRSKPDKTKENNFFQLAKV